MKTPRISPSENICHALGNLIHVWKSNEYFGQGCAVYYEEFISKIFTSDQKDFQIALDSLNYFIHQEKDSYVKDHGILMIVSTLLAHWSLRIHTLEEEDLHSHTEKILQLLKELSSINTPDLALFYKGILLQKLYNNPTLEAWEKKYKTSVFLLEQQRKQEGINIISQNQEYYKIRKIIPLVTKGRDPEDKLFLYHGKKIVEVEEPKNPMDVYQLSPEHKEILESFPPSLNQFLSHPQVIKYIKENPHHRISLTTSILLSREEWQTKIGEKFPYLKKFLP